MIGILLKLEFAASILVLISTIGSAKSQNLVNCHAYTDKSGNYSQAQSCSVGKFCCGSCTARFCCDDSLYTLNQTMCPPSQNHQRSITKNSPIVTSTYSYIIVYDTIYWVKIGFIVVPVFIFVVLLTIGFILCARARKARNEETRLIYSFQPQHTTLPMAISSGSVIHTIPNDAPKYDTIKNSSLANGAFLIQTEELPKYDEIKKDFKPFFSN